MPDNRHSSLGMHNATLPGDKTMFSPILNAASSVMEMWPFSMSSLRFSRPARRLDRPCGVAA